MKKRGLNDPRLPCCRALIASGFAAAHVRPERAGKAANGSQPPAAS